MNIRSLKFKKAMQLYGLRTMYTQRLTAKEYNSLQRESIINLRKEVKQEKERTCRLCKKSFSHHSSTICPECSTAIGIMKREKEQAKSIIQVGKAIRQAYKIPKALRGLAKFYRDDAVTMKGAMQDAQKSIDKQIDEALTGFKALVLAPNETDEEFKARIKKSLPPAKEQFLELQGGNEECEELKAYVWKPWKPALDMAGCLIHKKECIGAVCGLAGSCPVLKGKK